MPGLFSVFLLHGPGEVVVFIGTEDLAGLEGHCVGAGHPVLQPVFADLVMEPRDVARIDRNDTGSLTELAGVQHGRLAEGDDGDVDD
ncbi:MAG: hypothetical protein ABSC06_01310 [Rhodopila sp.]|jgi:hypothetical protein